MIKANNSTLKSWIEVPENSDFPIQNIPFGVAKHNNEVFVATRIGDTVINLYKVAKLGYFNIDAEVFISCRLNDFMLLGKQVTRDVRNEISDIFVSTNTEASNNAELQKALINNKEVEMLMPISIGDYTDFYSSEQHAFNVGCLFRDPNNALLPNWKHIPVGYHGRSSSILPSGVDFHRPKGQRKAPTDEMPTFGQSNLLDFELETAFFTYEGKPIGDSISTDEADEYIFGMALLNDWSARDIQGWEYVPLGPFLGKNFASHLSCWIVTLDALEPFRVSGPVQEPKVLPYLEYKGDKHVDINLEVAIKPENTEETIVSKSNYRYMYWNMNQQLAHHSINGCNIKVGDCMGSGTISGPKESEFGSMLEISWKGTKAVKMTDGTERKFINDNDTVIMRGYAEKDGIRIGFGEVKAKVLPVK
ncbi:fumarylacetoacetase [Vicingus serpentipes]|uniref:fumarylacetoacetase n=2 Tax=Vicingus serpentipes TaxID=1926625 RepID=A0A5C6RMW3_9FLAO|nr:fumarylacetoacetase [Vicingus serpentipes]TXB63691.1 fumarylacetoacetase [Vicingus serpentipes]